MDPGSGVRGDALLKNAECVRFSSVIPAKAGIHVHRNETAEDPPEISNAAVTCLTKPDTTAAGGSAEARNPAH
jgi:hypothetical protein